MKKILLTAAVAVCAMAQTFAIPAWRGLIKVKQPDGTFVSFYGSSVKCIDRKKIFIL